MNHAICRAVVAVMIWMISAVSFAQVVDQPISGSWRVSYADHELGLVSGRAEINEAETSAVVTFVHPTSGATHVLSSSSFERSGAMVRMVLEGQSPHSEKELGLEEAFEEIAVPETAGAVTFSYGESTHEVQIAPRFESDLDRVELTLALTGETMSGHWQYSADPVTLRDREGYGRVGFHAESEDGGVIQRGIETWNRPSPLIYGVIPVEDQLAVAVDEPAHPYPFQPGGDDASDRRFLFVFGEDLPQGPGDRLVLRGDDDRISYQRAYYQSSDGRGGLGGDLIARGRQKMLASLPPEHQTAALEHDFIVIEATLEAGVVPGHHRFYLNDVAAGWLLQFGDNSAEVAFVRQVSEPETASDFTPSRFAPSQQRVASDGYESTDVVYLRETVSLEVRTNAVLPVDEIPLLVSHNGQLASLGGSRTLTAYRTDDPRVYRTERVSLVREDDASPSGSGLVLPTSYGSQLSVRIAVPDLISVPPALPVVQVLHRRILDDTLWHNALGQAAACFDIESRDWRALPSQEAAVISNRIIISDNPFERLDIRVSLADHAAMILLRDRFITMMEHQDQQIESFQSDDELRVFRGLIEPSVRSGHLPLGRFDVTFPDGSRDWFSQTYDLYSVAEYYRQTVPETEAWVLGATREVIADFRGSIRFAIGHARDIDPCDVEEMLSLTGLGYDAVVTSLLPRLMTPFNQDSDGVLSYEWQPDRVARAAVLGVHVLADAVRAQAEYSELDSTLARAAVTVAAFPLAMGTSWVSSGINFVLDTVDLAYVAFAEIPATWRSHQEYAFARGASAVLGTYRFELAEAGRRSIAMTAASAVLSGASFGRSVSELPEAYLKFQSSLVNARIRAGRTILRAQSAMLPPSLDPPRSVPRPAEDAVAVPGSGSPVGVNPSAPSSDNAAAIADDLTVESQFDTLPGLHSDDVLADLNASDDWLDDVLDEVASERVEDAAMAARNAQDIAQASGPASGLQLDLSGALDLSTARPNWAENLSDETWSAFQQHQHRPDIQRFIDEDPARLSALLNENPDSTLAVIFSDPRFDLSDLEGAVAQHARRQSASRGQAFFDSTHARHQEQSDRLLNEHGIAVEGDQEFLEEVAAGLNQDGGSFTLRFTEIRGGMDTNAKFTRVYNRTSGTLNLANAEINTMRRWIPDLDVPFIDGRGTPTTLYANLRSMNAFGIGYAGSGAPLRQVTMSTIINPRTAVQLAWLRNTYPDLPDSALIPHTFSYQYAETAITNAGYRITGATLDGGDTGSLWMLREYYAGREDWASFIQRHGLTEQDRVSAGFEFHLTVEPAN